jgi:Mg2+-importing ATPase
VLNLKENKAQVEKQKELEKELKHFSRLKIDTIFKELKSSYDGLSVVEIDDRFEEYGKNIIDTKNNNGVLKRLKEAFINPFNIVLILVAIVTFITDVVIATDKDYATFILIISAVIISAMISFWQEAKSDKAAKKLQQMISNKIDVIRDGNQMVIDVSEVVPGDIVKLSSGDMIPGDVRFLITKDLFIDQASLTGESNPVEKFSDKKKESVVTDLSNIGFMGTNVVSGTATAIVLTTGNNTYFGNMAKSIYSTSDKNSFEKGVDSISKLLIQFMLVMVPIILIINLITKGEPLDSIVFAITIAVGLTPEMLPVIMTSTLAKGAVDMSKKKTIVKRLRKHSNIWRNEYFMYR